MVRTHTLSSRARTIPFSGRGNRLSSAANTIGASILRNAKSLLYPALGMGVAAGARRIMKAKRRSGKTRPGLTIMEGATNSMTVCNFGTKHNYVPKGVWSLMGKNTQLVNGAANLSVTPGIQGATVSSPLPASILTTICNQAPGNVDRVCIEEISSELQVANAASSSTIVTFYDVINRKDTGQIGSNADLADCLSAWATGDTDQGATNTYTVIGSLPFESDTFNQFFEVVSTNRVIIAPGGVHTHKTYYKPYKVLHAEHVNHVKYGIQGLTHYTMMVAQGQPAHDSTTQTTVSICGASIDYVVKTNIAYRYLLDNQNSYFKSDNLVKTFAVGVQFVNEEVGQVQDASGLHPTTLSS